MHSLISATTPNSNSGNSGVHDWSKEQVAGWIAGLGFSNYSKQFAVINGNQLISLTNEILKNELNILIVGHQIKILNAIYHLKKLNYVNFKSGDYIPNSVYLSQLFDNEAEVVFDSYLKDLNSHVDQLEKVEKEKDQQMISMKNQLNSLKNELNYYKDVINKPGGSSMKSSRLVSPNTMSASEATIRVYGNQLPGRRNESYKTFKVVNSDDCVKLILECISKYKVNNDWKEYMLLLVVGGEKDTVCLNPTDKIMDVCNQHVKDNELPASFIIQHIRHLNGPTSKPLNLDPGTFLAAHLSLTPSTSAIGIYEYEAQSRVELDVHVGVKFSILARDGEWSVVERNGQRGSVPTACIYEAPGLSKPRPPPQEVFCVHEYNRRSKNELNVRRGDKLILLEKYHHWCLVQHYDMGLNEERAVGLVPFTFLSMCVGEGAPVMAGGLEIENSLGIKNKSKRLSRLELESPKASSPLSAVSQLNSATRQTLRALDEEYPPQKSPLSPRTNQNTNLSPSSPGESARESFKSSVQELEKFLRNWESILQERQDDMPESVKTLKDIRKLMQYVFSSSSPIHNIILKRPLSGMITLTLDEVCKKNSHRWLQYTAGKVNGMERHDLDSILYSSIRKNYSSLMKIVNLVLEDSHVASLILKEK